MSDTPSDVIESQNFQQTDFERITCLVTSEFQVEEALLDQGVPTYYLKWPQETKQSFIKLLTKLEEVRLLAFLRKSDRRVSLRVIAKPPVKASNPVTYWILFIVTVATTFFAGYVWFENIGTNPLISGAIFSVAIMTVLGLHEMGHKLTANKNKVDATSPYFIPGPPPLGTMGAVIMQKSLPRNRDALFDIGANGPIFGFIVALVFSALGMVLATPTYVPPNSGLNMMPLSWIPLQEIFMKPPVPPNNGHFLNPILWAGWAGMLVTMLNLFPAGMLDGGHVARSMVPDRFRYILTITSVAVLFFLGSQFYVFAFIVIFMSFFRHPGPLDDVSSLSTGRKLATMALAAIFALSFPIALY
jgi:membrane-associated protease RseP (regulator of RpoE activity)